MIVVTGAAGFIGSCLVTDLIANGYKNLIAVDDFTQTTKDRNLQGKQITKRVQRDEFLSWAQNHTEEIEFIFHLGARTDTLETSSKIFKELNLNYSKGIWKIATDASIPLIYASSAATYGDGTRGYSDEHELVHQYKPLNNYGDSKHQFDLWALTQESAPPYWAGLKFFNVYGPNEYHKGKMASMLYQAYQQIEAKGEVCLFKSYREDFRDGEQSRDFIYVKEVTSLAIRLMEYAEVGGLVNVGSGSAQSFNQLITLLFYHLKLSPKIRYIEMPVGIRPRYQYFTQAELSKTMKIQPKFDRYSLETATEEYVKHYLRKDKNY